MLRKQGFHAQPVQTMRHADLRLSYRVERKQSANAFCFKEQIPRPADPKIKPPEADLRIRPSFVERGFYIQQPAPFTLQDGRKSEKYGNSYRLLVSSAEIQNLEFLLAKVPNVIDQSSKKNRVLIADFSRKLSAGLVKKFQDEATAGDPNVLIANVKGIIEGIQATLKDYLPIDLTKALFTENPVKKFAPTYTIGSDPEGVFQAIASAYATLVQDTFVNEVQKFRTKLDKQKKTDAEKKTELTSLNEKISKLLNDLYSSFGIPGDALIDKQPLSFEIVDKKKTRTTLVESPVFPVSDDKGYRVLGTYRYGRGIKLMPDSILDQLTAADPKSLVSASNLLEFLRSMSDPAKQAEATR
ncbi:MAG: hypothetical protein EBU84_20660, partial [Actinobacteria bacterium]|nr:hypothetical protein [Actinomycetota bacterium]